MSAHDTALLGIAPDHRAALLAGLVVLAILPAALSAIRRACGRGVMPAVYLVRGIHEATLATRLTACLLLASGAVHLTVGLQHGGATGLALLLNGLTFLALGPAVFLVRWWRPPAVVLLIATILAYLRAVGSGDESFDQLGMTTTLLELTALALVLLPRGLPVRRRRLSWATMVGAVFVAGTLTGAVTWAALLKPHNAGAQPAHLDAGTAASIPAHVHGGASAGRPPTPAETQAAAALLAQTRAGIARFADQSVALAEGYRVTFADGPAIAHYENKRYAKDSAVLDPNHPETLVYAKTVTGPLLVGAMYMLPRPGMSRPEPGGPLTRWHTHSICVAPLPALFAGLAPPSGVCPAGSIGVVTPAMLHVWTVDNPAGPFAEQFDPAALAALTRR